jgi:poly(A) polymerase
VWRRDFTANALYYNIADFSVWDYVGGVGDVRDRVLRLIGDPRTRYREDPVRMLRAVRFAAKLGFTLHADTAAPVPELARMLDNVPAARLFDEVNKIFLAGSGERALELLIEYGLLEHLFPSLAQALDEEPSSSAGRLVRLGLQSTDHRVQNDKPVTPMFLFAVLFWPAIQRAVAQRGESLDDPQALQAACDQVVFKQMARVAIPRRFTAPLRELIGLQARFGKREGRRALRLPTHPRFRAAYDFMLLRAAAGEIEQEAADWWTQLQAASPEEQLALVEQRVDETPGSGEPRKRRRRRRRKSGSPAQ